MSFTSRERSLADGQPRRLYTFARQARFWRYTSADQNITLDTQTYPSVAISDDGIRQTGNAGNDVLTLTAPADLEIARLFRGVPPSSEVLLTVRDLHWGDDQAIAVWIGRVASVNTPSLERCQIRCQTLAATLAQPGLRLCWSRNCPYSLYDRHCTVNPDTYRVPAVLTAVEGFTVTAGEFGAYPDGWFAGGFLAWDLGAEGIERRGISAHQGQSLTLLSPSDGLHLGQAITAYPGCTRVISVCERKFNNADNYGGVPGLPGKSPFDGSPVF